MPNKPLSCSKITVNNSFLGFTVIILKTGAKYAFVVRQNTLVEAYSLKICLMQDCFSSKLVLF